MADLIRLSRIASTQFRSMEETRGDVDPMPVPIRAVCGSTNDLNHRSD